MPLHIYLAGPNVFYPDPVAEGKKKKEILATYGLEGRYPMDNAITEFEPNKATALRIAAANEELMDSCEVILANMEPWHHGPSMDVGTAFEMGYMSRRAKEGKVLIIGYYEHDETDCFLQRVIKKCGFEPKVDMTTGVVVDAKTGMHLENFGLMDNLMLVGAVEKTGGRIFQSFADACANVTTLWHKSKISSKVATQALLCSAQRLQLSFVKESIAHNGCAVKTRDLQTEEQTIISPRRAVSCNF